MARRRRRRRGRGRRRGQRGLLGQLRPYLPWLVVALVVLGVYGFWLSRTPASGEEQEAVCLLVVDRTGSSDEQQTVERYRALAEKTIEGCKDERAKLAVYYFDQASPKLVLVNDEPYQLYEPKGRSSSKKERELEDIVEEAEADTAAIFDVASGDARGSDILTAYRSAAENLNNQAAKDGVDEKYLVILTDGIQLSEDVSVDTLTSEDVPIQPLLDRAVQIGLIPELEGTQVSFVGVRGGLADTGDQVPEWFEAKVQEFWTGITDSGGGNLCTYVVDSQVLPVSC